MVRFSYNKILLLVFFEIWNRKFCHQTFFRFFLRHWHFFNRKIWRLKASFEKHLLLLFSFRLKRLPILHTWLIHSSLVSKNLARSVWTFLKFAHSIFLLFSERHITCLTHDYVNLAPRFKIIFSPKRRAFEFFRWIARTSNIRSRSLNWNLILAHLRSKTCLCGPN